MNKVKMRLIAVMGFLLAVTLMFGVALFALPKRATAAKTYEPSSVFWSRTNGDVKAYKQSTSSENAYVAFVFGDEGTVEFHRHLALKWFEARKFGEGEENTTPYSNPGTPVYFTMEFSFGEINFSEFTIELQSGEENITKDEQSVNRIHFEADANGAVTAYIQDAEHADDEDFVSSNAASVVTLAGSDVSLALSEEGCDAGEFALSLNGTSLGKLTNIGGNYLEYRTSGTANTPILFKTTLSESAKTAEKTQKVFMKSLNKQSFTVTEGSEKKDGDNVSAEADGSVEYVDGVVTDNAPSVLVMSEKIYPYALGQRYSGDYKAIDVLYDNPTVSRYYYMLAHEKDNADEYHIPDEGKSSSDYKTLTTSTYFFPPDDLGDTEEEYVSIRFTINDGRDGALDEFIYLTWYADLDAVYGEGENAKGVVKTFDQEVTETKPAEDEGGEEQTVTTVKSCDFILVVNNTVRKGPYYTVLTANGEKTDNDFSDPDGKVNDYQTRLDNIAAEEKMSSGTGAYFYLPSLRELIASDYADYRNLRFSVYYKKPTSSSTASSETSLRYNNLRFQVDKAGLYRFRVIAQDASGNAMQYYRDGELVTVTGDNVWDIENIPEFTFYVDYKGATIEPAGEQSIGYRGSNYTVSSFEIVEGENCKKEYSLFYVDESHLGQGETLPSYTELVENTDKYFDEIKANDEGREQKVLVEIGKYNSDIKEGDDDWDDTDNAYAWNPDSSLSFTPQKSGYYIVRLTHTDPNYRAGNAQEAYQVIEIRNPVDYIPGQSEWLQNNLTSVILFSISGVLAVIIVILFVVKPSDKNVEEVDLTKLKGKKEKKSKK